MVAERNQALITLKVYEKRGRAALEKLSEGEVDDALSLCLWRGAAFHNFKVLDSSLAREGVDLASDQEFIDLWQKIRETNLELADKLSAAKESTKEEWHLARLRKTKIAKFHSGGWTQGSGKMV